jgi:hypothetical protein
VRDAGIVHLGRGTAELFGSDDFSSHLLDHRWAGDKHLRGFGLNDEVG